MDKHFILFLFVIIPLQLFSRSKVVSDTIFSDILNTSRSCSVYLPPSYQDDKKYPVLYLLHGMSQTDRDWVWRGHIQEVADRLIYSGEADEMIIVMPEYGGVNKILDVRNLKLDRRTKEIDCCGKQNQHHHSNQYADPDCRSLHSKTNEDLFVFI